MINKYIILLGIAFSLILITIILIWLVWKIRTWRIKRKIPSDPYLLADPNIETTDFINIINERRKIKNGNKKDNSTDRKWESIRETREGESDIKRGINEENTIGEMEERGIMETNIDPESSKPRTNIKRRFKFTD